MLIRRLTSSDVGTLKRIRKIYTDSISAFERKPQAWIEQVAERADYSVFVALDEDEVIGFGIVFVPIEEPFALLEYFAVDFAHRGRRLGSDFLKQIIASVGHRCLLAEVDSETVDPTTLRRQLFYRRLGFRRVVGLKYVLPLAISPPEMDLMLFAYPRPLARGILTRWLEMIYHHVYGKTPDDPRLIVMISQLSDTVAIE
jgi:ribosomal protein S18 acetylase RimI-like enzyme